MQLVLSQGDLHTHIEHVISPIEGPITIGRNGDISVVVMGRFVSRQHATIEPLPTGWLVRDNNSANGIYDSAGKRVESITLTTWGDSCWLAAPPTDITYIQLRLDRKSKSESPHTETESIDLEQWRRTHTAIAELYDTVHRLGSQLGVCPDAAQRPSDLKTGVDALTEFVRKVKRPQRPNCGFFQRLLDRCPMRDR
jgi:hypothetical protein